MQLWRFDQPASDAPRGIAMFLRQIRTVEVLGSQDMLRGRRTNALGGTYTVEQALDRLLRGSGLRWLRTGKTSFSIVRAPSRRSGARS